MPLDTTSLQDAIKTAFKKAKDTPPPTDPSQTDQVQEQILTQLAQDLADALETFVQSGDVDEVTVDVFDDTNTKIGTGSQTGFGKIK